MAALTLEQLRARSRAKFPITVVRDEDYTTLTPTQIADAWTGYVGGAEDIYMQNVAGTWAEMDPDLPKANNRGLLVFGGGKQYAQRCDFADVTVGLEFPASWAKVKSGLTVVCSGKSTIDGLPAVQAEFAGTTTNVSTWLVLPPGGTQVPDADIATNDVVCSRTHVYLENIPAELTGVRQKLYSGEQVVNAYAVLTTIDEWQIIEASNTEDSVAGAYALGDIILEHANGATYSSTAVISMGPSLISVNTAFPDYFHCINTSTSAPAIIVPEVLQRPWEYEGPWSVELEFTTPPRVVGGTIVLFAGGEGWADGFAIAQDANGLYAFQRRGNVSIAGTGHIEADPGDTVKIVFYQTAQITKVFVNGASAYDGVGGREKDGSFSLGHNWTGGQHSFATFKSYKYRRGLATDAQLEEWSTAA